MFEREHHRRIAAVLQALDPLPLVSNGCLFGGGTAIALRYGEYRESVDIDFIVSYREGYRQLRQWLSQPEGINTIDLRKAIDALRDRPHRLDHCMRAMRITALPKAALWARIKALRPAG